MKLTYFFIAFIGIYVTLPVSEGTLGLTSLFIIKKLGLISAIKGGLLLKTFKKKVLFKRSVEVSEAEMLLTRAALEDNSSCGKKYICILSGSKAEDLSTDQLAVLEYFANENIDQNLPWADLSVASLTGKTIGSEYCSVAYSRCKVSDEKLENIYTTIKV